MHFLRWKMPSLIAEARLNSRVDIVREPLTIAGIYQAEVRLASKHIVTSLIEYSLRPRPPLRTNAAM